MLSSNIRKVGEGLYTEEAVAEAKGLVLLVNLSDRFYTKKPIT